MKSIVTMSIQTRIPVSVRITQEDADFIAALQVEGAHTASEKIRALLTQARLQHEQEQDFAHFLQQVHNMLALAKHNIATWEKDKTQHSTLIARAFEILPDLLAYVASESPSAEASLAEMKKYEAAIAARLMHLVESVLQLAVTGASPCYDEQVLIKQLDTSLALAQIILQQKPSST